MDYIIETADPRAPGFFIREGDGKWQFEPDHRLAMKMSLQTAKDFVKILAMKDVIARVCDIHGNAQTEYVRTTPLKPELTLHNSHETFTYSSRGVEIPVVHAKHIRKYFFRFTNNPMDPSAPVDQSISGDSPAELIDRFVDNPGIAQTIKDRFKVDTTFVEPVRPDEPPPGVPSVTIHVPGGVPYRVAVHSGSRS